MLKEIITKKAIMAGLLGTTAMTILMLTAPMMGMPEMNIGKMLGSMMGGITALGWMAHFMIGTALSLIYSNLFANLIPGPAAIRGMVFALIPWLFSQAVLMPMMGEGFFSGSMIAAGGSMMGHLVFGSIVGAFYNMECKHAENESVNLEA